MRRNKVRTSAGIPAFIFCPNYLLWHETLNYLNSGAATLTWLLIFAQTIKAVRTEIDATGAIRFPLFFAVRPGDNSLLRGLLHHIGYGPLRS